MFKRLEDAGYLGPGLLKNNTLKCFQWPIIEKVFRNKWFILNSTLLKSDFRVVI